MGVERRIANEALTARAGHAYIDFAVARDSDRVGIAAGIVFEECSRLERGLDAIARLVRARVVHGNQKQSLAGVGLPVVVGVLVTLEGEEVAFGPTSPFLAAGELVVDVNEVRDRPHVVVAERTVVALAHPGDAVFLLVLVVSQVVPREVDDRCSHASQDVSVGQFEFARRIFVVAVGKNHAFLRAETGRDIVERGQISIAEGRHDHLGLAREVEVAGLNARVRIARIAPVVGLSNRTDEKLGINQGIVATQVIRIHVVERVRVAQSTALVEVFLDVVDKRLVAIVQILLRQTEIFLAHVFRRIETHAVVVHGVAEPVDPAGNQLAGIFRNKARLVEVGIFFRITVMAHERRRVRGIIRGVGTLETSIKLQDDVHQADEFLVQRAAEAIFRSPLEHARRTAETSGLARVHIDMEILRNHSGIGPVVGTVAGMVENNVRVNLQIHLVGVVHHLAQGRAGAVSGLPTSPLRMIPEIKAVIGVVADIAAISVGVGTANRGFARRRSPDGFVSDFGDFGQTLVDFVPRSLEVLNDDF